MAKMTAVALANRAKEIAQDYKTTYIWGGVGIPITEQRLADALAQYPDSNQKHVVNARRMLGTGWGFDCVCLIKAILWGWTGNRSHIRGGAKYLSNGVPDINADEMMRRCKNVSTNFSNVQVGEALGMPGHIGIYIGDGLAVECTPAWENGCQITAVGNIGPKAGYPTRTWKNHGKLPWVSYEVEQVNVDREIVKKRFGFNDTTMDYLENYKYGKDLLAKLASAK